jgi:glycosyltransferase involved in cell wall biosynthesis
MRVLHITPHLGGGVGSVIRGYLDYESKCSNIQHFVLSLDYINPESKVFLIKNKIKFIESAFKNLTLLNEQVILADIVLVHWWNHPLLQFVLLNHQLPIARLLVWAHISGSSSPNNFNHYIFEYADRFIFTTPLSFYTPEFQSLSKKIKDKVAVIWSTAGVEKLEKFSQDLKCRNNIIGYVGNLDYTKLHPDFLSTCNSKTNSKKNYNYVIIGPLTDKFSGDLKRIHKKTKISVTGYIPEDHKFRLMSSFKIFGYPLARGHYGTCDQVIQEAMALGAVPVVLNNPMESYMVKNFKTGLVVSNMSQYEKAIDHLIQNDSLRLKLSKNAQNFARKNYSVKKMSESWLNTFNCILKQKKNKRSPLSKKMGRNLSGHEIFIYSLGYYAGPFIAYMESKTKAEKEVASDQIRSLACFPNWNSPSKSSPSHFYHFFKNDKFLKSWANLTKLKE